MTFSGFIWPPDFKIESSGRREYTTTIGTKASILYDCAICRREIPEDISAINLNSESLHKLCRNCTKQLAKFFDDNRSAIISM